MRPWPPWPRWKRLTPRRKKTIVVIVLFLLFSAVLMSFPALVRDLLVDPALRLFLILDSFPQGIVWIVAVAALGFLSFQVLRLWPKEQAKKAKGKEVRISGAKELLLLLRRAKYSPWARRALRRRLARIFVAIRTERERIPSDQAWQELWAGIHPGDCALGRFLRGAEEEDFQNALRAALDELHHYAQGGEIDG
ncbi:hypothetical protein H5T57_01530 [Candidatus Bipolaricaulota bacterium]|nr:hypothetical protein [Candidatus Bipolaricaulota bacterium]